jgi:hypothetical protein
MDAAIAAMSRGVAVRRGYNFLDADAAFHEAQRRRGGQRLHRPAPGRFHTDLQIDPRLPLAAQLHAAALNGGSGSDGSTPKE